MFPSSIAKDELKRKSKMIDLTFNAFALFLGFSFSFSFLAFLLNCESNYRCPTASLLQTKSKQESVGLGGHMIWQEIRLDIIHSDP
jgi:hypothetical protein